MLEIKHLKETIKDLADGEIGKAITILVWELVRRIRK